MGSTTVRWYNSIDEYYWMAMFPSTHPPLQPLPLAEPEHPSGETIAPISPKGE